jgi:selenocysteine-specific elongation factor
VLDPDPNQKLFRDDARVSFLRQRAESPNEVSSFAASQLASDRAVRPSQLLLKSKFSAEDIFKAVSRLAAEGKAVLAGDFAVDAPTWQGLRRRAAGAIEAHHRAHPEQTGLSLSDLRLNLGADLLFPEILEFLVKDLCGKEFIQVGNAIRSVKHQPSLPPLLQAAVTQLRATLESKHFDPPSRNQLAPDSVSQQAVRFLVEKGELVEINSELVLTAEGLKRMTASIRQYIQDNGPATVSQLRQTLGCSRRVLVPLLERLDREGLTLRDGDFRKLRSGLGFVKRPGTKTA